MYVKDNFDQEVLGVFFSKAEDNCCANDYVEEGLGHEADKDDDEDDDEDYEEYDEEYD